MPFQCQAALDDLGVFILFKESCLCLSCLCFKFKNESRSLNDDDIFICGLPLCSLTKTPSWLCDGRGGTEGKLSVSVRFSSKSSGKYADFFFTITKNKHNLFIKHLRIKMLRKCSQKNPLKLVRS